MGEPHWTETLFRDHPDLFLAVHEAGWDHGADQAAKLEGILARAGVRRRRLLDAPCGIGRHAVALAHRGWEVVGLELVPEYVERARARAEEAGVATVRFYTGDLREVGSVLEEEAPFHAVANLLTSLGYWDDATDRSILRQYGELAAPGAVLFLDTINRDYVVRNFQATSFEEFGDVAYREERRLNLDTSRIESTWTFYRKEGDDLRHALTVDVSQRAYAPHELARQLEAAGWRRVRLFSGWDLKPLTGSVYRLVALARR